MSKSLFFATLAMSVCLCGAALGADIAVTVSAMSCKLDPADMPPVTPNIEAGKAAAGSNGFPLAYNNFLPLAQKGDTEAERLLGALLLRCGNPADKAQGLTWLGKAADAGDTNAAYGLGTDYLNGTGGVAQDDAKAFVFVSKAAQAGLKEAQGTLGYLYSSGRGTEKDPYQAVVWTVKAAEQGGWTAMFNIARDYSEGTGLPQDDGEAAYYMWIAFQRTPPIQHKSFATLINSISTKLNQHDLVDAGRRAQRWAPGKDSLSDVMRDADRLHKAKS